MAHNHKTDAELIQTTHNTARFFTEHRQVAMVLLIATFIWGVYGYLGMPKRKDPNIPVRVAVAQCRWPGASAEQVEQLVTRPIEQAVAANSTIKPPKPSDFGIRSISFPSLSVVYIQLDDSVKDKKGQFSDINLKLNQLNAQLPQGAGPIQFNSDFGDTAALMLTVASPKVSSTEIALRARAIQKAMAQTSSEESKTAAEPRVRVVYCFPLSVPVDTVRETFQVLASAGTQTNTFRDPHIFEGPGFIGLDISTGLDNQALREFAQKVLEERLHQSDIHPDAWQPAFIRNPAETEARLAEVAGDRYSYRELDDYTDLIQRTLQGAPEVSRVDRSGVLPEQIYLIYSQERAGAVWLYAIELEGHSLRPEHHSPRWHAGGWIEQRADQSLRTLPGRARYRQCHYWSLIVPKSGLSARSG